jgi:hypothetical protein
MNNPRFPQWLSADLGQRLERIRGVAGRHFVDPTALSAVACNHGHDHCRAIKLKDRGQVWKVENCWTPRLTGFRRCAHHPARFVAGRVFRVNTLGRATRASGGW